MTYQFRVGEDGRTIVLPDALVRELDLKPGEGLTGQVEGRTVHLTAASSDDPLLALRESMRGYTLDQFLADRRRDGDA
jgi:AbrB family transcriptional regulator (stage V sporulation protein T)